MAAHRAGIERIILPKRNQKDLRDVPDEVKDKLKFEFAETAEDVLKFALGIEVADPLLAVQVPVSTAASSPTL